MVLASVDQFQVVGVPSPHVDTVVNMTVKTKLQSKVYIKEANLENYILWIRLPNSYILTIYSCSTRWFNFVNHL